MELYYVTKSKGKTTYKIAYFRPLGKNTVAEHKRLVMKINSKQKQNPNDRCACGSNEHCTRSVVDLKRDKNVMFIN